MQKEVVVMAAVALGVICSQREIHAQTGEKGLGVQRLAAPVQNQAALLNVKVNHASHAYELGEPFEVQVTSRVSGFLYLLYVHSDDSVNVLFPNALQADNSIRAAKTYLIPGAGTFRITATPPLGDGTFKAIVTNQEVKALDASRIPTGDTMLELDLQDIKLLNRELTKGAGVRFDTPLANEPASKVLADFSVKITTFATGHFGAGKRAVRKKKRFVLAVGVGEQIADGLRDYPACATEAKQFGSLMKDDYGASEVVVLTNSQVTRKNVQEKFRGLVAKTQPGDEFILFWSGHGDRLRDDTREEKDGVDEILILHDTDLANDQRKRRTSISDDLLGRWLQDFSHCEVLVIFDTCFSGGQASNEKSIASTKAKRALAQNYAKRVPATDRLVLRGQADSWEGDFNTFSKDITPRQAMVFSSSRAGQVSFVRKEQDNSVMTYYLLEYLRSHRKTNFNPQDMFDYVAQQSRAYVDRVFGCDQVPVVIGNKKTAIRF